MNFRALAVLNRALLFEADHFEKNVLAFVQRLLP